MAIRAMGKFKREKDFQKWGSIFKESFTEQVSFEQRCEGQEGEDCADIRAKAFQANVWVRSCLAHVTNGLGSILAGEVRSEKLKGPEWVGQIGECKDAAFTGDAVREL